MNKRIIILTIFIIIGMIIVPTVYKIYDNNNKLKIKVVEEEFLYQAIRCYNKGDCNSLVYLKDLYQKDYIEYKLINPLTKKYYEDNSYVDLSKDTLEIKLIS